MRQHETNGEDPLNETVLSCTEVKKQRYLVGHSAALHDKEVVGALDTQGHNES